MLTCARLLVFTVAAFFVLSESRIDFTGCRAPASTDPFPAVQAQTQISFTQVRVPSVVMIRRAVCVEPLPITVRDCTNLELYTLSFSDGSQRIMVGIPDDGNISKSVKWVPVPIVPPGT